MRSALSLHSPWDKMIPIWSSSHLSICSVQVLAHDHCADHLFLDLSSGVVDKWHHWLRVVGGALKQLPGYCWVCVDLFCIVCYSLALTLSGVGLETVHIYVLSLFGHQCYLFVTQ